MKAFYATNKVLVETSEKELMLILDALTESDQPASEKLSDEIVEILKSMPF